MKRSVKHLLWGLICSAVLVLPFSACTPEKIIERIEVRKGSVIHSGQGAPAPSLGEVGDYYIDLLTSELYGAKTALGWGKPISLKGIAGQKGEKGDNGQNGQDGAKGDKGDPGRDGKNGQDGAKGDKGDPGRDGKNGQDGAKGDKGDPGRDGKNGQDGAKGDKGDPGRDGKNGQDGAKGDKGDPGRDGSRIYGGQGAPQDNLGKEGDWYIDKKNKRLYGPKTEAGWGNDYIDLSSGGGGHQPNPNPDGPDTPPAPPTPPTPPADNEDFPLEGVRYELPRWIMGANIYNITYTLQDGSVNYSTEYDTDIRHPRWVAFTFDSHNSVKGKGVKRSGKWLWDSTHIPQSWSTVDLFAQWYPHNNQLDQNSYDRGHMVASNDRRMTQEAEKQTFYFSNVSPQLSDFNQGYWQHLEDKVQKWGRDNSFRDVMYVAKGGSIKSGTYTLPEGVPMARPSYYWMAMLVRKGTTVQALAFWVEHKIYGRKKANFPATESVVISIDELEEKTGLDLFYNLPDKLEKRVEAQAPDLTFWEG
ncbi:DNA/RNA non-specific endonuclease [Porphyromonas sp. COT-290 OH860]|uniref:DNA/RNA non-specific endonuclease n=1 Tax=Porphyromonas sp. COT-290 OH860 TaxID=1515615 RepID=UPI0009DCB86B|nr:DNA/RNA non-specific endonuclease [Porphyromonas sp. COT-290 OH860]